MPLRDHFHPPLSTKYSWEGIHGIWPGYIVEHLIEYLPSEFIAEPRVHLGNLFEIDVCAFENHEAAPEDLDHSKDDTAHATCSVWTAPAPTLVAEVELVDQYEYEVLVFDLNRDRQLVAAVEIVSPGNKDRLEI